MHRRVVIVSAIVIALIASLYVGSPYWAVRSLRAAAVNADVDALEQRVDFPSVRESLRSQLSTALLRKMSTDPELKGNPFAQLGATLVPTIVGTLVDTYITPQGVAAILRGAKPNEAKEKTAAPELDYVTQYVSLDRFRVRLRSAKSEGEAGFLLERRGFATWKLIRLELPDNFLENSSRATKQ